MFCHEDEAPDHDHRSDSRFDERFEPDHPVTGVDWYDAYAYASWQGKKLPSRLQWEKAARGPSGRLFPWGDEFDGHCANWIGNHFDEAIDDLDAWVDATASLLGNDTQALTQPTHDFPENVSPYGVRGLCGNVWEWTRTRHLDGEDVSPSFRGLSPRDVLGDWSSYISVKGGSWASVPEMLVPAYSGQRHIFARGLEVGFRCVYEYGSSS